MEQGMIQFVDEPQAKKENVLRTVFSYDGMNVSFAKKGNVVMINATEMAKKFGETVGHWFENDYTRKYIIEIANSKGITPSSPLPITLNTRELAKAYPTLVNVVQGGNVSNITQGTWMHEDVALEFARWLSPAFAVWCNTRIKELLTVGMTATQPTLDALVENPDLLIKLATQLKEQREANQKLLAANGQQQMQITSLSSKNELQAETIKKQTAELESSRDKVEKYDATLNSDGLLTISTIADHFGISGKRMNKILEYLEIQYKQSGCYHLYAKYQDFNYTETLPQPYTRSDGSIGSRPHMYWRIEGREWLLTKMREKILAAKEVIKKF